MFFFITSLYFFLVWLDDAGYVWLILSFIALTATILFKSDFMLGSGAYFGLLCMKKVKNKEKIVLVVFFIILAIISFIVLRQWMTGITKGYTTSSSNFLEWFKYFSSLMLSRGPAQILKGQVGPIVYGPGIFSFFAATIAFIFYIIKKRTDILLFVLAWTALPTIVWFLIHGNSARHNMLAVLPFIMIIFLFVHEKAPRSIAFIPIILILGNYLITAPSASTFNPSGNLFKSQGLLDSRVNDLHCAAAEIAGLENNKIIFTGESFRPYIYYEIFSKAHEYELIKIEDSCNMIIFKNKKSIICTFTGPDPITDIRHMIIDHDLKGGVVVAPVSPELPVLIERYLTDLKEKGFEVYRYTRYEFLGRS